MTTLHPQSEQADPDDGQPDRAFQMLGFVLVYATVLLAFPVGCTLSLIASSLP